MSSRKTSTAQAELVLLPTLKNCLLNLPSSLVAVLLNSNTLAQNVIVELSYRVPDPKQPPQQQKQAGVQKSVFLGWTGMQSKAKLAAVGGKDGLAGAIAGSRGEGRDGGRGGMEREVPVVEVDATFARLLGLGEGMKVRGVRRLLKAEDGKDENMADAGTVGWRGAAFRPAAGAYGQY